LKLPDRSAKPRSTGLTMVIDSGHQSSEEFGRIIHDYGEYIDMVKFSFGTAVVVPLAVLERKMRCLQEHHIDYYFGGKLAEAHILQNSFEGYLELVREYRCGFVEISNGTLPMSHTDKSKYVAQAAGKGLKVLSEVGYKDPARSKALSAQDWIAAIRQDFEAGASYVITEARESGTSGLADTDGRMRIAVVKDILESDIPVERIIFEAPTTQLQTGFIERLGANANLGNIAVNDVIALETLRVGLRSDTLLLAKPSERI